MLSSKYLVYFIVEITLFFSIQKNFALVEDSSHEKDLKYNITVSNSFKKRECFERYGDRSFLPRNKEKLPPIFYSFPGSGNTWGRLLIEHATGVYSGSVYSDESLMVALPGEQVCNNSVSVIKVHPHTHSFHELNSGSFHSDNQKCEHSGVRKFNRAVLLIRNPYDSIWSEYQRLLSGSHVKGIKAQSFDWNRWHANVADLSHAYHNMLSKDYAGVERVYGLKNVIYIRYENLKDKSKRVKELEQVTSFLQTVVSKERLHCAFVLAKSEKAHRITKASDMTKLYAYTKPIACRMWALFGNGAKKYGYNVWRNMSCTKPDGTSFAPIPKVDVMPHGKYHGPKMDFGGHEQFDAMLKKRVAVKEKTSANDI